MKDSIETLRPQEVDGNLNPYYTRTGVGHLVSSILDIDAPNTILDLGAGEGSLSSAATERWPNAKCTTADLAPAACDYLSQMFKKKGVDHTHYNWDVLTTPLPSGMKEDSFDLAVCNPPFYRPTQSIEHLSILSLAKLQQACPSAADNRAEILFLAQNIRLVREGGTIAFIIPDSLLTGERFRAFRRAVLTCYNVSCVVQLPSHSFHNTEARCFVLVIHKEQLPEASVKLVRYQGDAGLLPPILITKEQAEDRMDYDFHAIRAASVQDSFCLRDIKAEVRRGSFSTVQRKASDWPIFHTTDFKSLENCLIEFEEPSMPENGKVVIAEPGDILMARVDRSLHQKIAIVTKGRAAITDCVYRVRVPVEHQQRVFTALRSTHGEQAILSATKGVSARLLGKGTLLGLRLQEPLAS